MMSTHTEMTASTAATRIAASGKTSRGQYTLLSRGTLNVRLCPPELNADEKNVQGSRPRYAKTGYGTPWVSTLATRVNTSQEASMRSTGASSAQPTPSVACL